MDKENTQSRPADRIRQLAQWYIDHKAFRGISTFEGACGLSQKYIRNICATTLGNPGVDSIAKIVSTFKGINLYWLVLGDGDMFRVNEETAIRFAKDAVAEYEKEAKVRSMLNSRVFKGMTREEKLELMKKIWNEE